MGLADSAARGGAVTLILQLVKFGIQMLGIILLARLVSPEDFGIVVMVTAIIGIGDVLRDFGLSSAAVQAKQLSQGQASNLFWINTAIGAALMALCALSAPLISSAYNEPRLVMIALVLSISFLVGGIQTQFQAHIVRSLRYTTLAWTDLAAQAAGVSGAVLLALFGWGYWALVAQALTQGFVLLITRVAFSKWSPSAPKRGEDMRPLLQFGGNLVVTQVLVYVSSNVDSVSIGSRYGSGELGTYKRAQQMLWIPLNQILAPLTNVALPVLARLQDDRPRFVRYLRGAQALVGLPIATVFGLAAVAAPSLIPGLLGDQWTPSVVLFQIMALGGVIQAANYTTYWVFLALGRTRLHLAYSIVTRSILVSTLLVSVQWGPEAVAWAYTASTAAAWPIALIWLSRSASLPFGVLFPGGMRNIALAVTLAGVGLTVSSIDNDGANFWGLSGGLVSGIIVLFLSVAIPAYRRDWVLICQTGRSLLRKQERT